MVKCEITTLKDNVNLELLVTKTLEVSNELEKKGHKIMNISYVNAEESVLTYNAVDTSLFETSTFEAEGKRRYEKLLKDMPEELRGKRLVVFGSLFYWVKNLKKIGLAPATDEDKTIIENALFSNDFLYYCEEALVVVTKTYQILARLQRVEKEDEKYFNSLEELKTLGYAPLSILQSYYIRKALKIREALNRYMVFSVEEHLDGFWVKINGFEQIARVVKIERV